MKTHSMLKSALLTALLTIASASMAQKDILLYSTDFTDWLQLDGTSGSSDDVFQGQGAGAGFTLGDKPQVFPAGTIGGATGYLTINNGPNTGIDCKELDFIAGGAVEIEFVNKTGSNTRWVGVQGADAAYVEVLEPTDGRYDRAHVGTLSGTNYTAGTALGDKNGPDASLYNTWISGFNGVDNNGQGVSKVSFRLPASYTGTKRVKIVMHKDIALTSLKIYTTVGTTPYVSSTDYPNAGADGSKTSAGLTIQGPVGGSAVTGTVNVKAYNITSPVTLSLEGADAAKFSLPSTSLDNAAALAGGDVTVSFTPSVRQGAANALLKLTAEGVANPYYVNLIGVSGSATPSIVASTSPLYFWTYQTGKFTQTIDVTGLNLTDGITATLSDNINFAVSSPNISLLDATKGAKLTITFTGDIVEGTKNATLTLSSPGAASVVIPLAGETTVEKPETYDVTFSVSPAGSGYIDVSPSGHVFKRGTSVTATVTPETGYAIASWSDNAGSRRTTRTWTIQPTTPQTIIVRLTKGEQQPDDPDAPTSSFVALVPSNVSTSGFTARWTAAADATTYTVTVYDRDRNVVAEQTSTTTSADITGLAESTGYFYVVKSDSQTAGQSTTNNVGPFFTLSETKVCGQQ